VAGGGGRESGRMRGERRHHLRQRLQRGRRAPHQRCGCQPTGSAARSRRPPFSELNHLCLLCLCRVQHGAHRGHRCQHDGADERRRVSAAERSRPPAPHPPRQARTLTADICIYMLANTRSVQWFRAHDSCIYTLMLTPDGSTLVSGSATEIRLWRWADVVTCLSSGGESRAMQCAAAALALCQRHA
jgi:WD40 repeat protein